MVQKTDGPVSSYADFTLPKVSRDVSVPHQPFYLAQKKIAEKNSRRRLFSSLRFAPLANERKKNITCRTLLVPLND